MMRLSVLDQSPVISGLDARRAIDATLDLARRADELGFHRYWLAEHHAIAALADPCPEVLLARLGAETRRIRIGGLRSSGCLSPSRISSTRVAVMRCRVPTGKISSSAVPTAEEAARHRYTDEERRYVMGQRARAIIGGPEKCRRELENMGARYEADEAMVLTITGDYASRQRSYELLSGML